MFSTVFSEMIVCDTRSAKCLYCTVSCHNLISMKKRRELWTVILWPSPIITWKFMNWIKREGLWSPSRKKNKVSVDWKHVTLYPRVERTELAYTPRTWRSYAPRNWRPYAPRTWRPYKPRTWRPYTPRTWRPYQPRTWRPCQPRNWRAAYLTPLPAEYLTPLRAA